MQQTTQGYPAMAMPVQMQPVMAMPVTPVMAMTVAQPAGMVAVPAQHFQLPFPPFSQQPTAAPQRPLNAASQAPVAGAGAPAVQRQTQTRAAMYWQMMTAKGDTENPPPPPSSIQAETQRQPSVQEMKQRSAQELQRLKSKFPAAPAPAQQPAMLAMPGQSPANRPIGAQYQTLSAARSTPPMQDAAGHQLVEVRRLDGSVQVMSQREAMQLAAGRGNRLVPTKAGPPANEQFGPQSQRPANGSALPMSRLPTGSTVPMTQPTAGSEMPTPTPQGQGRAVLFHQPPPQGQQQVYRTPQQQDGKNPYNFSQFGSSLPQYSFASQPVAPSDWEADGPYQPPPGTPEAPNYNGYAPPQVQRPTVQPGTLYARPSSTIDGNVLGYDGQLAYQVPQGMQYVPQYAPQNPTLNPTPGSSVPMPAPMHPNTTSPLQDSALPRITPSGQFQSPSGLQFSAAMQPAPYVSQQQPVHMPPQQQQQAPYMMVPTNMHQQQQQAVPSPQQSTQQNQQWLNEGIEM